MTDGAPTLRGLPGRGQIGRRSITPLALDNPLMLWALGSLLLATFSLLIGANVEFVGLQAAIFLLTPLAWRLLYPISPVTGFVIALTFAKNFLVSQPIKLLLLQPADSNLSEPVATAGAILCGLVGAIVGGLIWRALPLRRALTGLPGLGEHPANVRRLGYALVSVGLISRIAAITFHASSVVFTYLSYLALAGVIAMVVEARSHDARRIFNWKSLAALGLYAALGFGAASRTEILVPFVFAAALYVYFRVWPPAVAIVGVLAGLVLVVTVISPTINYARMVASPAEVAGTFVEELGHIVEDPGQLARITEADNRIGQGWIGRLYYGRALNLLDRFTPNQIDQLVAISKYQNLASDYIYEGFRAVLPQTFGVQREVGVGQKELESAWARKSTLGGNAANYGLVGTLALYHGNIAVFVGFIFITLSILFMSGVVFGDQSSVWSLTFLPPWIFMLADGNWAMFLIGTVHGAIIIGGGLALIVWLNRGLVTLAHGPPPSMTMAARLGGRSAAFRRPRNFTGRPRQS